MTSRRIHHHEEEDEGYYMSMTDLMVGVLLIFILLMVYYALQINLEDDIPRSIHQEVVDERDKLKEENERLRKFVTIYAKINDNIRQSKINILSGLKEALVKNGFDEVEVDNQYGVLSMPADLLFRSGKSELDQTPRIERALKILSTAIFKQTVNYTKNEYIADKDSLCITQYVCVDNIYIEGHADSDRIKYVTDEGVTNNLRLSARRSTNTFQRMIDYNDKLINLYNLDGLAVLSSSAHGATRPKVKDEITDLDKQTNRRIDIRIIMFSPSVEDIKSLEGFENLIDNLNYD